MKRAAQNITAVAIMTTLLILPARAIEVGDVFFVSNGTGNTVINIVKRSADSVDLIAQSLRANAAEYCERYEQLKPLSEKLLECVRQNIGNPPQKNSRSRHHQFITREIRSRPPTV